MVPGKRPGYEGWLGHLDRQRGVGTDPKVVSIVPDSAKCSARGSDKVVAVHEGLAACKVRVGNGLVIFEWKTSASFHLRRGVQRSAWDSSESDSHSFKRSSQLSPNDLFERGFHEAESPLLAFYEDLKRLFFFGIFPNFLSLFY